MTLSWTNPGPSLSSTLHLSVSCESRPTFQSGNSFLGIRSLIVISDCCFYVSFAFQKYFVCIYAVCISSRTLMGWVCGSCHFPDEEVEAEGAQWLAQSHMPHYWWSQDLIAGLTPKPCPVQSLANIFRELWNVFFSELKVMKNRLMYSFASSNCGFQKFFD